MDDNFSDKHIIDSWLQNAKPWVVAIRDNEIASRTLLTNKAITDTILQKKPQNVLDIGCGEGWLARKLSDSGITTFGIDVVPDLVDEANRLGGGIFKLIPYEQLSQRVIKQKFDVAVCNFSLLGNESVNHVFNCIPHVLNEQGYFIIQTIHPINGCGHVKYQDGWRKGTWAGFNQQFTNPPPWYFRTLETWKALFKLNKLELIEILEPVNSHIKEAVSIIFISQLAANK